MPRRGVVRLSLAAVWLLVAPSAAAPSAQGAAPFAFPAAPSAAPAANSAVFPAGNCSFGAAAATGKRPCAPYTCAALLATVLPVAWHAKPSSDFLGALKCFTSDCECRVPALETASQLREALQGTSFVFRGDSTSRNGLAPLGVLIAVASHSHLNESRAYFADSVIGQTRDALRRDLSQIWPGMPPRRDGAKFVPKAIREPAPFLKHPAPHVAVGLYDNDSYHGLMQANISKFGHSAANTDDARFWILNYGVHMLHAEPARKLSLQLQTFQADVAASFHDMVRHAVKSNTLDRTILAWRATNNICRKAMYGDWAAALDALNATDGTGAAKFDGCVAAHSADWASNAKKAEMASNWPVLPLRAACARGTMDQRGVGLLNGLAQQTVRKLHGCYTGDTKEDDSICPSDLRGVAHRHSWRLPGVLYVASDAFGEALCRDLPQSKIHDGYHAIQLFLPLFRVLFAMRRFADANT
ncbi:hypothetical protein M885DRAFT_532332 [Pelagophyceae sp. CCMP2097]|nr:hypothetical protein M885DRAFT_532332 [Pelagophyceae sp. CCMP2097]|mmetsp:Transcript_2832/g.8354  ORF Transcript_2832/g.8354 Transcript_2832/m.8354 type:complete len:470 (+) Transcript_2832:77-1486(+)